MRDYQGDEKVNYAESFMFYETFKHACSSVSWKISYFSILIPKENRYRFGIPDCCFAFCFASINIDITIFAMRFNNSLTIRFVPVSHRVIY